MEENTVKEKILKAAEKLFAENGYDRTSTASVAQLAGVNSALIFYYFKSKEGLLQALITEKIMDYRHVREMGDIRQHGNVSISQNVLEHMLDDGLAFMKKNERVLRILLMESLKKAGKGTEIFEVSSAILEDILKETGEMDMPEEERKTLELKMFLFINIPLVYLAIFEDKLSSFLRMDKEMLQNSLRKIFPRIYQTCLADDLNIEVKTQENP